MTYQEANEAINEAIMLLVEVSIQGEEHLIGTPLNNVFGGISAAILSVNDPQADDDMKESALRLLEAIAMVIDSSQMVREIDIRNQIDDLTNGLD